MSLLKLRKVASFIAVAALCFASVTVMAESASNAVDGSVVVTSEISGEGTQESPYLVSDKAGLDYMASLAQNGATKGVYFKLTGDIVLNEHSLFTYTEGYVTEASADAVKHTPIGTDNKPFEGVLDGDGYYITGLYCDNTNAVGGLFGVVDGAVIKNLNLDFALVEAKEYAGLVAGKVNGETEISGCTVSGSVIGKQQELASVVGGIAGTVGENSVIFDCCNYGAVSGSNAFSTNVGGIAGLNSGVINKCAFAGKAYGVSMYFSANVGGIAGSSHGEISGCTSTGTVGAETVGEVNDCNAGGIAGFSDGYVAQCQNNSTVSAYCASYGDSIGTAGGIVGYVKNGDVYGCENNGEIKGEQGIYSGGIAGLSVVDSGEHKIYDCLNNAKVSSAYGVSGGIVGRISASGYVTNKNELTACLSTESVSGATKGGAVGAVYEEGATVVVSSCYYLAGVPDGSEEGTTPVANAGLTTGDVLDGLTNTDVWVFESGSKPDMIFADGLARAVSTITSESTQSFAEGGTVTATGVGEMKLSRKLTAGTYDVIVRFTGDENTFAPKSVVVNVTVAENITEFSVAQVDASALTVAEGGLSGKVTATFRSPEAGKDYVVIIGVFADGKLAGVHIDTVTTQQGRFDDEFEVPAIAVGTASEISINTMIVENTESLSPVCENLETVVGA